MRSTPTTNRLLLGATFFALLSSSAVAQTGSAQFTRIDAKGLRVETRHVAPGMVPGFGFQPRGMGIIWTVNDPVSIVNSICVSDTTNETFLGNNLNFERFTAVATNGDGTPLFEFSDTTNSNVIAVASAENATLAVMLRGASTPPVPVSARGFSSANGDTPLWTYTFDAEFLAADIRGVDVSNDGSIVAVVARDEVNNKSRIVLLNGATGEEIRRLQFDSYVPAVELSDDGARLAVTNAAIARVYRTSDLSELTSFGVSGQGGFVRISRDGTTVAAGGFNYIVRKEIAGVWTQILSRSEPNSWFGNGLALSGNGDTLFVPSFNYATGYLTLTYRIIDLAGAGAPEIARTTTVGSGGFQDTIQGGQASADGTKFVMASWGTADNVHPEVQIFDRSLAVIGSIDTPGSPFSVDMTADGLYVVAGGKHVHANTFGNGADSYSYRTGPIAPTCPCDWNSFDGVNSQDFFDFLTDFFAFNADYNHDTFTNSQDFFDFLACFFTGC